jgi:hypothetical protein
MKMRGEEGREKKKKNEIVNSCYDVIVIQCRKQLKAAANGAFGRGFVDSWYSARL